MKNFCIFCGKGLVGGACGCAEYIAYYGASVPAPAPAPAAPAYAPAPAPAPAAPIYEPAPAPAPASAPASKPMDSHFQSAGDL